MDKKIKKLMCNECGRETNHDVRAEHYKHRDVEEIGFMFDQHFMIVECCGCESFSLIKRGLFCEYGEYQDLTRNSMIDRGNWEEVIYPPRHFRTIPSWIKELDDTVLRDLFLEVYKALQSETVILATLGARTLLDRFIFLRVGDQGNFKRGFEKLKQEDILSEEQCKILDPVLEAGHAAAHRGWMPEKDQIGIILDVIEGIIQQHIILPKDTDKLSQSVPQRDFSN